MNDSRSSEWLHFFGIVNMAKCAVFFKRGWNKETELRVNHLNLV